jgi:large subunit ribosomal protein L4
VKIRLLDIEGKSLGHVDVEDHLFDAPSNEALVHQVVVAQQANARQGTVGTKNRAAVSGGGRKPWKQKGTGRARQGSIRSPQWKGGGVVFGPSPRSYRQNTPKRMKNAALRSSISSKLRDGNLIVIDKLNLEQIKTKNIANILKSLKIQGSTLLIADGSDPLIFKAARNLDKVKLIPSFKLNSLDVLLKSKVVMTLEAVRNAENIWGSPFLREKNIVDAQLVDEDEK